MLERESTPADRRGKRQERTTARPTSSSAPPDDPVTNYATGVVAGLIIAGPYVRAACQRHLNDLRDGPARRLFWDLEAAVRAVRFFPAVLTIEIETEGGESLVVPFNLEPWQAFIIGSLFGWKNARGFRRFRRAFVEVAKGNGKSPLAAGIGHYMQSATGKLRAEVYSAATDKDQADILFRDAVAMWDRSRALKRRLVASGQNPVWQLTNLETGSFFKPIAAKKKGKSGIRPYCALIDEVHEHPDDGVIEMMRAGTKGNQQALIFEITNSGFDKNTVCGREHDYTVKICEGALDNDAWFGFIASLDETDDPFEDESCWLKANPNLGVSIQLDFIREQVVEAKGMPSKEALVRRLHFCQWTEAAETWITQAVWKRVEEPELELADYFGEDIYLALDLSFTKDLTALAAVLRQSTRLIAFVDFFSPRETAVERSKKDGVDYRLWEKERGNNLILTPGKVVKLHAVASRLAWYEEHFNVRACAYDAYREKELESDLVDLGVEIPMIEHPQGFRRGRKLENVENEDGKPVDNPLWMPRSFEELENAIIEERLLAAVNKVLRWNVSSAVVRQDPAGTGNRVFDKRKATGRIDGVVALAMAVGAATARIEEGQDLDDFLRNPVAAL